MNLTPSRRSVVLAGLLLLAGGCHLSPLAVHVVDVDNGFKPLPGATVSRYMTPRLRSDPWPTTPTEVKQADGEGIAEFDDGRGRIVVTAPGRSSAAFYGGLPPKWIELGVGAGTTQPTR